MTERELQTTERDARRRLLPLLASAFASASASARGWGRGRGRADDTIAVRSYLPYLMCIQHMDDPNIHTTRARQAGQDQYYGEGWDAQDTCKHK